MALPEDEGGDEEDAEEEEDEDVAGFPPVGGVAAETGVVSVLRECWGMSN